MKHLRDSKLLCQFENYGDSGKMRAVYGQGTEPFDDLKTFFQEIIKFELIQPSY